MLSRIGNRTGRFALIVALGVVLGGSPALAQEEDPTSALFERGLEELRAGEHTKSAETFQEVIRLRPDQSEAYYNVACAYALGGDLSASIDWLKKAIDKGFDDADHIDSDTDLDAIRKERAFHELMNTAFGRPIPGPALVTLKGDAADLEALRGKPVVLYFWRSDSEPCRDVAPLLSALQKKHAGALTVVAISPEDPSKQEAAADELKLGMTLLRRVGTLPDPIGPVHAYPTVIVLDKDLGISKRLVGVRDADELERAVTPALNPKPKEKAPKKRDEPQPF
ncbi:MAG: TlpA family protein disulfide reductase [Planctomycetota bacterium]|jgi:thiol-disulfide isomerase/thioredoxin